MRRESRFSAHPHQSPCHFHSSQGPTDSDLQAVNVESVAGFEEDETTELPPLIVNYKKKALAPTVDLVVAPSLARARTRGFKPGTPSLVTVPKVALRGTIKGEEILVEALREKVGTQPSRPLTRFVSGREKTFNLDEPVELVPGTQTFVVRARSADSDSGEGRVTVVYQPRLPRLVSRDLSPAKSVLFEHEDPPQVTVTAKFAPPEASFIRLRERSSSIPARNRNRRSSLPESRRTPLRAPGGKATDAKGLSLTASVPLIPGENHIRIRLTNAWGAEWTSTEDVVAFRRPPRIIEVKTPAKTEEAATSVTATVESATAITEAQIEVRHDGQSSWVKAEPAPAEGTRWTISAANVPLEPGQSEVRVRARNLDGWNHEPGPSPALTYTRREAQEPPLLEKPDTPLTTASGEIPVPIAISSAKPLNKTELRHMTIGVELGDDPHRSVGVGRSRRKRPDALSRDHPGPAQGRS